MYVLMLCCWKCKRIMNYLVTSFVKDKPSQLPALDFEIGLKNVIQ